MMVMMIEAPGTTVKPAGVEGVPRLAAWSHGHAPTGWGHMHRSNTARPATTHVRTPTLGSGRKYYQCTNQNAHERRVTHH